MTEKSMQSTPPSSEKSLQRTPQSSEKSLQRTPSNSEKSLQRTPPSSEKSLQRTAASSEKSLQRTAASSEKSLQRTPPSSSEKSLHCTSISSSEKSLQRTTTSSDKSLQLTAASSDKSLHLTAASSEKSFQLTAASSEKSLQLKGASSEKSLQRTPPSSEKSMQRTPPRSETSLQRIAASSDPLRFSSEMAEKTVPRGSKNPSHSSSDEGFQAFADRFTTLGEVQKEIRKVVNVDIGLIFGIDYTMSNTKQGQKTFGGKNLHRISDEAVNPYQEVICILGETLEQLDSSGIIPTFGFGDRKVKDKGIFPLKTEGECEGFMDVLDTYNEVTPQIKLGGPTNFAPLIEEAVQIVKKEKYFHILVIVADGQVTNEDETIAAIVQASQYPLSIVVIGVGDGPWDVMKEFDDKLPERLFDNFQFVDFHGIKSTARNPDAAVALSALMLVPDQFGAIRQHELLNKIA